MEVLKVGVVGTGVIGEAVIKCLLFAGNLPSQITIKEKNSQRRLEVTQTYGVIAGSVLDSDVLIIAVKPQDAAEALSEFVGKIRPDVLVVSMIAGIKSASILETLGDKTRVIRVMTNTPLVVQEGMSAVAAGQFANSKDLEWVVDLFSSSGRSLVIKEELMDSVTAVSGSGPAYIFKFAEAMIYAAIKLGLSIDDAKLVVHQTLVGAVTLISEHEGANISDLTRQVVSPNGTTAAALEFMDIKKMSAIVVEAIEKAKERSVELSQHPLTGPIS